MAKNSQAFRAKQGKARQKRKATPAHKAERETNLADGSHPALDVGALGSNGANPTRKATEAALQRSTALFQATFEQAAVGIAHLTPDGHWLRCNQRLCAIVGYTAEEMLRKTFQELTHPDDLASDMKFTRQMLQGEIQTYAMHKRYFHKNGHLVWANLTVSLVWTAAGAPDYFVAVVEDITQLKHAEQALIESEARYRQVVEDQVDLICRFQPDFRLTFVNRPYREAFGQPAAELIGQSILNWIPLEYHAQVIAQLTALNPAKDVVTVEHPVQSADGTLRWLQWTNRITVDEQGRTLEYQSVGRDTTERRQTEEAEREQRRWVEAQRDSLAALTGSLDEDRVMQQILDAAATVVPSEAGSIILFEAGYGRVAYLRGFSREAEIFFKGYQFPIVSIADAKVRTDRQPYFIPETKADSRWIPLPVSDWIRSSIGMPIEIRGEIIGLLSVDSATPNHFQHTDIEKLRVFAYYAGLALEKAQHVAMLETRVAERTGELQRAKERVEAILNSSLDGILLVHPDLRIQQTNRAFNTLIGLESASCGAISLHDLIHPDDVQRVNEAVQTGIREQVGQQVEMRCYHKNGTVFEAELSIGALTGAGLVCTIRDITERKRSQNALAEERNLLRTLIDAMPSVIYVKDRQHRFVLGNAAAGRSLHNLSTDKLIGKTDFDFFPPALAEKFYAEEQNIFATGKPVVDYEDQVVSPQGNIIWLATTKVPLYNLKGELIGLAGASYDITEMKKNERQLRYYASLQENVSDAVIATDLYGRIQSWNRAAETIYGWPAAEVIERTVTELLQTRYSTDELPGSQYQALLQQGWWQGEVMQRCKDGTELCILASVTVLKDEHGLAYGLVAINHDITEQKQAHEALRASEARYRLLADNVTDWVARINPSGEYLYTSPSTQTVLGYEPEELLKQWGYLFVHPDDKEILQAAHQNVLDQKLPLPLLTYRRQHKDGHYVWLETKSSAICSPETGELLEFVTSSRDITERKRAEEALHLKIEEERTFQHYLKALHEITIELTAIDQLDEFYKRVIELGLERLGFERIGLLFYDAEHGLALGTYGTDPQGRVIAEQHVRLEPASLTGILQRTLDSPDHFTFDAETQLFSDGKPSGFGWNAVAALWNGQQSLGWLAVDNGVHHRPASKPLLDTLALYSLTIGTLLGRKQLEVALRKSEENFRLLVEAAPLAIILSDQSGQITLINHRAELLFAYSRSELIGQSVDLLVPANAHTRHSHNRATYIAAPRVRQIGIGQELYARRKDGHEFPVEIELSYVETPAGLIVMSFILDISERKRADEALREQRDFLQLVINSVPDLILVKDRAGRFQLTNERTASLYGITPATIVGKTDADLNPNPDEVAFFRQKDQEVLESGQSVFIPEQTILGRYYQTSKIPLKNPTGQLDRLLIVSFDITKHKQAEAALQQALEQEKELGELKSRFVSMASHEFRTPLMSIQAVTETLHAYRHKLTDNQIANRLEDIKEQVNYLKAIMEDVLELAHIQTRRVEIKPIQLDLAVFCQNVIEEFQSRPDVRHRLVFQNEAAVGTTALDKRLMRQIISNLVSNAIKYSPEDKRILVHLQATDSALILQVRDQGIGIPAADVKHLFQPFHRATNVGVITGTGLGLTITKEAVEQHGGTITVESQVGVGTTFTVSIPIGMSGGKNDDKNLGD